MITKISCWFRLLLVAGDCDQSLARYCLSEMSTEYSILYATYVFFKLNNMKMCRNVFQKRMGHVLKFKEVRCKGVVLFATEFKLSQKMRIRSAWFWENCANGYFLATQLRNINLHNCYSTNLWAVLLGRLTHLIRVHITTIELTYEYVLLWRQI